MNTDGYSTPEGAAQFVVTHTSGDDVIVDEYSSWADASARAEEVYRGGDFPVTVDSTADERRWSFGDDGELTPVPQP